MEGYGIYFGIIEMLRDNSEYKLNLDFDVIAYDLRADVKIVEKIVKDYKLFEINETYFYSKSLRNRMLRMDEIREKRAVAGQKGGFSKAVASAKQLPSSKVKESKVNKSKGKESREKEIRGLIDFFNQTTNSDCKFVESNKEFIRIRLNEGYTVENCKSVIIKKHSEWINTDMEKYIRIETLFRKSKFDGYLNQKSYNQRLTPAQKRSVDSMKELEEDLKDGS